MRMKGKKNTTGKSHTNLLKKKRKSQRAGEGENSSAGGVITAFL